MRKLVTTVAFLGSLAASATAQSGAEITMPPKAEQSGLFPFANKCLTAQTFKISAVPPEDWLRVEPATVGVGPDSSFAVRVTVDTSGNRNLGKYRSSLMVVCTSCCGYRTALPAGLQRVSNLPHDRGCQGAGRLRADSGAGRLRADGRAKCSSACHNSGRRAAAFYDPT